ncbi:MAG: hypothetical protein HFI33_13345 [Lachnospiraceae bacterium]|nr:hypothetical protein [Lachnospiraceae bacterium]
MKKRYGCLALAAFMLVSSTITAYADDYKGKDGWKAEFTGDAIDSNFTSKAFAEEVTGLQPGDSIEIQVAVKNGSNRDTDWYMSNEVLQSLEDSSSAKGGAYTYVLTYVNGKGESTTLYSSESVGGEAISAAGEGLHEATDNLEQFFYLDRLGKGGQGHITLKVALNGETQGNAYQNTLARLQLNFAVEGAAGDDTPTPGSRKNKTRMVGSVQTGDPGGMVRWSIMTLISGLALLICAVIYQKKSRGGEGYE